MPSLRPDFSDAIFGDLAIAGVDGWGMRIHRRPTKSIPQGLPGPYVALDLSRTTTRAENLDGRIAHNRRSSSSRLLVVMKVGCRGVHHPGFGYGISRCQAREFRELAETITRTIACARRRVCRSQRRGPSRKPQLVTSNRPRTNTDSIGRFASLDVRLIRIVRMSDRIARASYRPRRRCRDARSRRLRPCSRGGRSARRCGVVVGVVDECRRGSTPRSRLQSTCSGTSARQASSVANG